MVVVVSPGRDYLPGILHIPEPVLIETGIAETGIEALHKGVLRRLAGLAKLQAEFRITSYINLVLLVVILAIKLAPLVH